MKDTEKEYREKKGRVLPYATVKRLATFGVDERKYNKLLEEQDYKCAICRKPFKDMKKLPSIDHNHNTNKIRGLLCTKCNTAIGLLGDSEVIFTNAARYIRKYNKRDLIKDDYPNKVFGLPSYILDEIAQ